MPFKPSADVELERLINIIGLAIFPCCLCLSLPVFIYTLVLEKETKLVETMKINSLKMHNYWIVNFFFCIVLYLITATIYYLAGAYIFKLNFFVLTNGFLMFLVFFGWGFC
jgi:hypothetical protein